MTTDTNETTEMMENDDTMTEESTGVTNNVDYTDAQHTESPKIELDFRIFALFVEGGPNDSLGDVEDVAQRQLEQAQEIVEPFQKLTEQMSGGGMGALQMMGREAEESEESEEDDGNKGFN